MSNPLLTKSTLPYGAPQFDKIENRHYIPAFKQAIEEGKAEVDAIVNNPENPSFENTIEALEYAGESLERISHIFYNLFHLKLMEDFLLIQFVLNSLHLLLEVVQNHHL